MRVWLVESVSSKDLRWVKMVNTYLEVIHIFDKKLVQIVKRSSALAFHRFLAPFASEKSSNKAFDLVRLGKEGWSSVKCMRMHPNQAMRDQK